MDNVMKNVLAAICTAAGFIFGEWCGHLTALIVLIVLDYISGVAVAVIEKRSPPKSGQGALQKRYSCC